MKYERKYILFAHWILAVILGILSIGIWSVVYARDALHVLRFAVLDVGQGDALFIESPSGVQILIDGGAGSAVLRELPGVMSAFDRSLDAVIATHPDADHIGGLVSILSRYEVGAFIEPGIKKDTVTNKALEKAVEDERAERYIARRGMTLDLGGEATLHILFPDYDVSHISANKANEGGIVARLVYGDTDFLLMADVSKNVENRLIILEGKNLQSDVLKVGHHGSKTSTDARFVSTVSPSVALISVGAGNSYGHPTKATLDTLAKAGASIYRTDQSGTLLFESDGKKFWRK